jgi:hypothetical protein
MVLEPVRPYPLIQRRGDAKEVKLEFGFTKYKEDFISNFERVDKFLTLEGTGLEIVY